VGFVWSIGRLRNIEIRIDFSWFIVFILLSWTLATYYFPKYYSFSPWLSWIIGILASLLLFFSVLVHELGHCLVAQRQGKEVKSITLFILGGIAQIANESSSPYEEFSMAIAGPLTSFSLAIVFAILWWIADSLSRPIFALAKYLTMINVILGTFNLLPGYPMDGGRVLRAILWKKTGNIKKATKAASKVGRAIAFLLISFGVFQILTGLWLNGLWLIFIGWFLYNASLKSYQQTLLREILRDIRAKDLMDTNFITIPPDTTLQQLFNGQALTGRHKACIITEEKKILGIICLEDIKKIAPERWPYILVREIMIPRSDLVLTTPEENALKLLHRLSSRDNYPIPVIFSDRVVGTITRNDILKWAQISFKT